MLSREGNSNSDSVDPRMFPTGKIPIKSPDWNEHPLEDAPRRNSVTRIAAFIKAHLPLPRSGSKPPANPARTLYTNDDIDRETYPSGRYPKKVADE